MSLYRAGHHHMANAPAPSGKTVRAVSRDGAGVHCRTTFAAAVTMSLGKMERNPEKNALIYPNNITAPETCQVFSRDNSNVRPSSAETEFFLSAAPGRLVSIIVLRAAVPFSSRERRTPTFPAFRCSKRSRYDRILLDEAEKSDMLMQTGSN